MIKELPRVYKSLVYHGETCLGVLDVIPVSGQNFQFPNNEIRIHHVSPPSDRCLPLSVLQTVATVRCKLESSSSVEQPRLINLHAACFSELKTAAVVLGNEEIHLVAMPSKRNKLPCFWCYSVPFGLYRSTMELLNARCLALVFDLDETLFVANTMKSYNDRVEALQSSLARETDPVKLRGIVAELKWYADDRALLMQYTENDCVMDNGKMFKVQMEEIPQSSSGHEKVHRPIIRMHENNIVLTRINPEIRDTSVLVRLRPSWEDLRSYLIAKGRKRFEVYVCTMAEREYALEMWRLLDPEANLIASSQHQDRVFPVKSGDKKSLQSIFQDGKCHPKMAVVIDDRLKVWEDRDQPQVHVVPRFDPCYAPQAEMTNPVLCVVRNFVCNVRGCFFKEFDENFLPKMSYIFYEDDVATLPPAPDVSNYLISKVLQDPPVLRRNPSAPKHRSEVDQRLNQACGSMAAVRNIISELNKGIKLNGDNYKIWHKNVRMVLVEMNAIDHINRLVERPVRGIITDEQRVFLNNWDAKDAEVRAAILSTMNDDILYVFEQFQTSKELWDALRSRFGGYTTTQLRALNIAFDSYRMNPQHNMREHLMQMANMVAELKEAGQVLTEEQKIQALIRSLPDSWEHVKIRLAHSDHLNTVELVWKQLELEEDLLNAQMHQPQKQRKRKRKGKNEDQPSPTIPVTNEQKGKGNGAAASNPKGKFRRMQNVKCFKCGQKGHLAGACRKPHQNHGQPAA